MINCCRRCFFNDENFNYEDDTIRWKTICNEMSEKKWKKKEKREC